MKTINLFKADGLKRNTITSLLGIWNIQTTGRKSWNSSLVGQTIKSRRTLKSFWKKYKIQTINTQKSKNWFLKLKVKSANSLRLEKCRESLRTFHLSSLQMKLMTARSKCRQNYSYIARYLITKPKETRVHSQLLMSISRAILNKALALRKIFYLLLSRWIRRVQSQSIVRRVQFYMIVRLRKSLMILLVWIVCHQSTSKIHTIHTVVIFRHWSSFMINTASIKINKISAIKPTIKT